MWRAESTNDEVWTFVEHGCKLDKVLGYGVKKNDKTTKRSVIKKLIPKISSSVNDETNVTKKSISSASNNFNSYLEFNLKIYIQFLCRILFLINALFL